MIQYPKTENLFTRDEVTHKLTREFRHAQFSQVNSWLVTEKIDGTNIRIGLEWEDEETHQGSGVAAHCFGDSLTYYPVVTVRGRSDEAPLPGKAGYFYAEALGWDGPTLDRLVLDALTDVAPKWREQPTPTDMVIFGEGYGPGIQKGGGNYATHKSLRIFDVITFRESGKYWRSWTDVEKVGLALGLSTVPVVMDDATMQEVVEYVTEPFYSNELSSVSSDENPDAYEDSRKEGVVARTDPYLFDRYGNRVMFKLKFKDVS